MAAIPISGIHLLWDVFGTLFLLLTIVQWRDGSSLKPWAWLTCTAVAGLALTVFANGQNVSSILGPILSIGCMVGTLIYIRRLYCRNMRHGLLAVACLAIGVTLHILLAPTDISSTNPWKYGVGFGVSILLLALASSRGKVSLELSALAILAIISLATGTRGLAGTLVIVSVFVIARGVAQERSLVLRLAATTLLAVVAVTLTLTLGSSLIDSGLANSARDRFQMQSAINSNPILAGRTEPPISISAAMTYPLIGAGIDPEPTPEIVSRALHIADVLGYTHPDLLVPWWTHDDQIYTHSVIMEFWVVGGVLAALPFIAASGVLAIGLVRSLRVRKAVPALAIFLAAQSLSDMLFGPETFGSTAYIGMSVGFVLATLFAPDEARDSLGGEIEEPPHPSPQFGVAQGLRK